MGAYVDQTLTRETFYKDRFVSHRLAYATFLSLRHKYIYVETPKNACTSTKLFLMQIEDLTPPSDISRVHARDPNDKRSSLFDLGCAGTTALLNDEQYIKFCVFRDPARRLFSAFRNKLCDLTNKSYDDIRNSLIEDYSLSKFKDIRFVQFAEWVCEQPDELRDHHYRSQWSLNMCDFIDFDFVVRMDHYADDMRTLMKRLDLPAEIIPDFGRRTNVSNSDAINMPPGVIRQISNAFRQDFDILKMHKGGYD